MTLNMSNKFGDYHTVSEPFRENKESIHSGQFMVSHFEEVQDDDNGIEIPEPDDRDGTIINETINKPNLCQEVQLYIPKSKDETGKCGVTSHLEIETSLTKLFKCMNLAYSQKLTSPKWNHFKGVRLRWKDKIRLNNVIWRCWHMQFILKRRTPVCQFASPLDVDVHSNPQSVVLEGKYWKRQLDVIKAEYRKWRRNFKVNVSGYIPYDTISELDFMELSSLPYDRSFFQDDFYSDTLFSSIIEPFPFPDRREIARSANNADLLQPNLGALQPNLDDIDLTFHELLQNTRLPPVPEEGADEIMKGSDYNFSSIMEEMDTTSSVYPPQSSAELCTKSSFDDPNMMGYKTTTIQDNIDSTLVSTNDFSNQLLNQPTGNLLLDPLSNLISPNNFSNMNSVQIDNQDLVSQPTGFSNKTIIKGRITKPLARPFRIREPHNYDKAQPTLHQTNMYQQMLAEQQQQQQLMGTALQYNQKFTNISQNTNNFLTPSENINSPSLNINSNMFKSFSIPQVQNTKLSKNEQRFDISQSQMLDLLNFNSIQDQYQNNLQQAIDSTTLKPTSNLRKAASTGDYINIPTSVIMCNVPTSDSQLTNPNNNIDASYVTQQIDTSKVIFRSNSLPINSSIKKLQSKDENFAVPKYSLKSNRSRTRSHSTKLGEQNQAITYLQLTSKAQLQTATSEPMLNSTLAQLLTTNQNKNLNKCSSSNNAIVMSSSLPPSGFHLPTVSSSSNNLSTIQSPSNQISVPNIALSKKSNSMPHSLMLNKPARPTTSINSSITPKKHNLPAETQISSDQDCSPISPSRLNVTSNIKFPRENQRRAGHIHAEQKRRYNIKNGFDLLHSLIPQLQQNPNAKLSKAAMLQKGAEYIKQLRSDRNTLHEKMDTLSKERDSLNSSLAHLHSILPANGAPVSRQRTEVVKQLYNQYVRYRTMENWKFWILGLILEPLVNSYTTTVSTASIEELHRTALHWVDQYCSLIELRPGVSNKLRYLSMTTDILSDPPSTLKEEVIKAVNNTSGQHPNLNNS